MAGEKPIYTVKYGAIQFSVWDNKTDKGSYKTITFSRTYKDGDKFKQTNTFKPTDLPLIQLGLNNIMEFINKKSDF